MPSVAGASTTRPIRPDMFATRADGRPALIGSRCRETGEVFWPAEAINPRTHRDTMERVEIDGGGRVVSWTIVSRGLPGFASPYALAAIELDAGPSLVAQLEEWDARTLDFDMPVDLVLGTVKTESDGTAIIGPKFRPRLSGVSQAPR